MRKKHKDRLVWVFFGLLFAFHYYSVGAHEMWIEPLSFQVKPKGKVFAQNKVGQFFKGNSYAYLDSNFKHVEIIENGLARPINSRLGDRPFIQETINDSGLVILSALTTANTVTYKTEEQFSKFITAEKLNWVFLEHKKRGLPPKNFTETYTRSAKSLVKVGRGNGNDMMIGLPLEWVLTNNPYTTTKNNVIACLYWQGKAFKNKTVHVFKKTPSAINNNEISSNKILSGSLKRIKYDVTDEFITTDNSGCITVSNQKGIYLLNAVKMFEPELLNMDDKNAVWESVWGSITYSTMH